MRDLTTLGQCDRTGCDNDWVTLCFVQASPNPTEDPSVFMAYLCDTCFDDEPFAYFYEEYYCNGCYKDYAPDRYLGCIGHERTQFGGNARVTEKEDLDRCINGCVCGDPLGQGA